MMNNGEVVGHDIGYKFLDNIPPTDESFQRLDVFIRDQPTLNHFDPKTMELTVWAGSGNEMVRGMEKLKIHFPWPGKDRYRVILGRMIVRDRGGKVVEAFTFGGDLSIETDRNSTHCHVSSQVPIIDLEGPEVLSDLLVSEVEAVLAEYRAEVLGRIDEFEQRLGGAEPLSLYVASMITLKDRFKAFSHVELPEYQQLIHLLQAEIERLKGERMWPEDPKSLAEILLPTKPKA